MCKYICTNLQKMTLEFYAQQEQISLSTLRARLRSAGIPFNRKQIVDDAILRIISTPGKRGRKRAENSEQIVRVVHNVVPEHTREAPAIPEPAPETTVKPPAFTRQHLLDFTTACELLFVLFGASWLFGWLGGVCAAALISFYVHTAVEMRAGENAFAHDFGLFVCAALGCVFAWLHGQTFWKIYTGDCAQKFYVCAGAAFLLSLISFCALAQTRLTRS